MGGCTPDDTPRLRRQRSMQEERILQPTFVIGSQNKCLLIMFEFTSNTLNISFCSLFFSAAHIVGISSMPSLML